MLSKGHILAILVIGISFVTVPVFAVEKGQVHGQESESLELEFYTNIPDFVDPKKDLESYLDRYYSEADYRKWFDKNYPDWTIEEAVGLIQPYSLMKEQFNECARDARERLNNQVKGYIESGGSAMDAEIMLAQRGIDLNYYLGSCDANSIIPLNDMGVYLIEREEFHYAIYYLDNALDLYSDYHLALLNKGMALFALEEYQEARTYFEKALEIDPSLELAQEGIELTSKILEGKDTSSIVCGPGTVRNKNGQCVPERATMTTEMQEKSSSGGGCLIATATFGSELSPQVQQLRELRDNHLLKTESGSTFMSGFNQFYYSFSPTIADWERQNPVFKEIVKVTITPLITSLSLLNYVDMDSETEVLGYGISLILLNLGMYVAVPVGIGLFLVRKTYGKTRNP